jgi:hypothetical protein
MIEFTADGPFSEKADPLFPDRVRIIGLGQTGASVCDQLVLHGRPGQDIWVFDTVICSAAKPCTASAAAAISTWRAKSSRARRRGWPIPCTAVIFSS